MWMSQWSGPQVTQLGWKQISARSKRQLTIMEVMIAMTCRRQCCIYRARSPFECNRSCPNARDIYPGLWWHNTPPPNLTTDCPSQSNHVQGVNEEWYHGDQPAWSRVVEFKKNLSTNAEASTNWDQNHTPELTPIWPVQPQKMKYSQACLLKKQVDGLMLRVSALHYSARDWLTEGF